MQAADDGVHPLIAADLSGPLDDILDPGMAAADKDDEPLLTLVGHGGIIADKILLHAPAPHYVAEQGGLGPIPPPDGTQKHQAIGQPDRLGRAAGDQSF